MNNEFIIKYAAETLRKHGPMASIVLSYCLRDDLGIEISSIKLAQIIRIYGKDRITRRPRTTETGFGSYSVAKEAIIYDVLS